jgi:16S rRNA (guanine966-N2)-methyltransferase
MRIVGGKYKGKKLSQPIDKITRPLKDLVKESIFNIIQHSKKINVKVENSKILDLYAGSGSFGLECISRNADLVCFFEKHLNALKILSKNINLLGKNLNFKIYNKDCFKFLATDSFIEKSFDIIFLDPPFKEITVNEILDLIDKKNILKDNGIIIVHRHIKDKIIFLSKYKIIEERKYGISKIFFLKKFNF